MLHSWAYVTSWGPGDLAAWRRESEREVNAWCWGDWRPRENNTHLTVHLIVATSLYILQGERRSGTSHPESGVLHLGIDHSLEVFLR
jgi:hypothetical protein